MTINHVVLGTGAIGRAVAEELVRRGESVRMVNRSGEMQEAPAGVEVVASDLYDHANVREVTRGATVVYQASQPPYYQWPEKFPLLQESIIDGLTGSGAKLVIVENVYMYGTMNGRAFTEDMPYRAHTRKGRVRGEISSAAFSAHRDGRVRVTAARGGNFFGPWGTDSTMGARASYPLLRGKPAQLIGRTDVPHTHTYVKDFGAALVILGERAEADGQVWHVPNDQPTMSQGELIRLFAEEAGVQPKISSMGKAMMAVGGLFIPEAKETVEMMYEFDQPFIIDSSKFEQTFGMRATPIREAIRETVVWYKSHPENSRLEEYKMTTALIAFLHHLFAFTLTACLVYEFVAYHKNLTLAEARRLQRMDLVYGISAGLLLVIGLLRVFFFEKGVNFYIESPFFWLKMFAFALVAILSIDPTIRYIRWNRTLRQNELPKITDAEYRRTRLLLWLEVTGIAIILLAAPMMARGIGMN